MPFVVQFGVYISPVGFTSEVVPEAWRVLYSINPMVGVIDGFRWAILGGDVRLYWPGFVSSLVVSAMFIIRHPVFPHDRAHVCRCHLIAAVHAFEGRSLWGEGFMSHPIITIEQLSKRYSAITHQYRSVYDMCSSAHYASRGRGCDAARRRSRNREEFWALRDVNSRDQAG